MLEKSLKSLSSLNTRPNLDVKCVTLYYPMFLCPHRLFQYVIPPPFALSLLTVKYQEIGKGGGAKEECCCVRTEEKI